MSTLTPTVTIGELVVERPGRSRVFSRYGIDYCCGGKLTLAQVCARRGLDPEALWEELQAETTPPTTDWRLASLASLVDHIIATYHEPLRPEMARLGALAEKVARVHGPEHPELVTVAAVFRAFRLDMELHMEKEEAVLFPLIKAIEAGTAGPRGTMVPAPIRAMEAEHDVAGEQLERMRELTGGYALPEGACNSYRALFAGLEELEAETHAHVHLENNLLFPRAIALLG
jgi:regulator of cell morphogenesis and NO signaling